MSETRLGINRCEAHVAIAVVLGDEPAVVEIRCAGYRRHNGNHVTYPFSDRMFQSPDSTWVLPSFKWLDPVDPT